MICAAGIVSGKEIMSLHLLRELKSRGHECQCIMSSWGSEDFRDRLRALGIPFFNIRIGFISKTLTWSAMRMTLIQGFYLPGLLIRFMSIRQKLRPDLMIHTNFHHAFLLYPALPKRNNIYWSHEIIANSRFYRFLFQLFYRKVGTFVCVSDAAATSLTALIGAERVKTIKNGTFISGEVTTHRKANGPMVLAIIGQVAKSKGHEVLLEALAGIPRNKYILRIIGSGDAAYLAGLKKLIDQKGLVANIVWMGFLKDANKIYEGVDAVIVPSIFPDPYPTTVMESGLRAIPVVASAIGGLPEMVSEGVNGFLAEPENLESLRAAIEKLIDHQDFDMIKDQSRVLASKNFSMETFANNFQNLIVASRL